MNEQEQRRQVELRVNINQQEHIYRHDTMEAAQVPEFLEETEQRFQNQRQRRQQLWDDTLREQPQQMVAQAETQPQLPVVAPPQETYKQSRQRKKDEKQAIKRGKKYAPHANTQTDLLIRIKKLNDPLTTGPEGIAPDAGEKELTEAVRRMTDTKISADMFTEQNFPEKSVILRRCLYEYRSIEGLMHSNPEFFQDLQQNDPLRFKKLQHCQNLITPLEDMLKCASISCGVSVSGEPIAESGTVKQARDQRAEQLAEFSRLLGEENAFYTEELQNHLEEKMGQQLPVFETRAREFQRQYLEDNPQSAWMNIPALNSELQFEAIDKAKKLLEQNGARYLANKGMCDAMFSDLSHAIETYAILKAQSSAYDEVKYHYDTDESSNQDSAALSRLAIKKIDALMTESYKAMDRYETILDTLKVFLKDGKLRAIHVAVLSEYDYNAEPEYRNKALQSASATAIRSRWQTETLERLLTDERVHVGRHESAYVQRAASMFRQNDDEYNIALLNHLERVRALGGKAPSKELYNSTRELLLPYVQKLLNWDMAAALRMSDEELINNQEQLDALFCDNMFVSDLLKMEHWSDPRCEMKNEILGDRIYEFAEKANVIRGLYEKSRGLAIKHASRFMPLPPNAFTEVEWNHKIGNAGRIEEFSQSRIAVGERLLNIEAEKRRQLENIYSEASMARFEEQLNHAEKVGQLYRRGKLYEVEQEFHNARKKLEDGLPMTEEERLLAEAAVRVNVKYYKLAGFIDEEARTLGLPPDIGEAIFRSFSRYTESESGRTMTPEQFRQMVLDIGAGYGMVNPVTPSEEIEEAREKNMRGLREYKESMRLQYGFLAKKYGRALEKADVKFSSRHFMELTQDMANPQTDINVMTKVPGFLDMNNPEDVLLMHQAKYYSVIGFHAINVISAMVSSRGLGDEHFEEEFSEIIQYDLSTQLAESRAYLMANAGNAPFENRINLNAVMDERRQIG